MDYSKLVLVLCLIGYAHAYVSAQDYVDNVLSNVNNKNEFLEKNPTLVSRIYRYFQAQHPRHETMKMLAFN